MDGTVNLPDRSARRLPTQIPAQQSKARASGSLTSLDRLCENVVVLTVVVAKLEAGNVQR
jgi:hypothetical protein